MKINNLKSYTKALAAGALTLTLFAANAQKLPGTQLASVRIPNNLKIDGKATEWKDSYQAYNKATDVSYTIANDDTRLYLIIHAEDPVTIKKIIGGGISFNINKTGDKTDKQMPGFTYPIFNKEAKKYIEYKNPGKASEPFPDSTIALNNKILLAMSKMISLNNGNNTDSLSIYNDKGIHAIALFDNKMGLTTEVVIDLKLLNISLQNGDSFFYHLQSNAMKLENMNGFNFVKTADGSPKMQVVIGAITQRDMTEAVATTDFWGEYKLVKK